MQPLESYEKIRYIVRAPKRERTKIYGLPELENDAAIEPYLGSYASKPLQIKKLFN